MHITVLGGTGFIGPHVVRLLAEAGHAVTVVHRGEHERIELPRWVRHVHVDRARLAEAAPQLGDADAVLDMAPFTEAAARTAIEALRGRVRRWVVVSSADVYRAYGGLLGIEASPLPEPPVDEDSPLRTVLYPYRGRMDDGPAWIHDYDKIPIERAVLGDGGFAGTALRLGAVYGPGDNQHRLLHAVSRIDDGRPAILLEDTQARSLWPYVYVENAAAAIALALLDDRAAGRVYNVGPIQTTGIGDFYGAVGDVLGWRGEVVTVADGSLDESLGGMPGVDLRHDVDLRTERIRGELGFIEPVEFAEGVLRSADWERAHRRNAGAGPTAEDYAREDAILAALSRPL